MPKRQPHRRSPSPARLDEMIEEATLDAYGESEQVGGFFTVLEERLKLPFKTEVLGMEVIVERLDLTDDEQIVAVCSRNRRRCQTRILPLKIAPFPTNRLTQ